MLIKPFRSCFMLAGATLALALVNVVPAQAQGRPQEKEEVLPLAGTEKLAEQLPTTGLPPAMIPADPANILVLDLSNGGRVRIQMRADVAPGHVDRIKTLAREGFYNGVKFHRVIEGFMAQTGDPKGDGTGGSPLPDLKAEFNVLPHLRGTVSMARAAGEDSANSQFFIVFLPRMQLDKKYTVFGRVIEGMQFVDAIPRGEPPVAPATIVQASIESDGKAPPAMSMAPVQAPLSLTAPPAN